MGQGMAALGLLLRPARAAGTDLVPAYEKAFAAAVPGDASLPALAFWRGRVALWAILRAAGLGDGDEVVLPAFTCESVPMAVKFAGARCAYAEAGAGDFNATPETIAAAVSPRTRVILCQHTYGVPLPMAEAAAAAEKSGAMLIEDCCQLVAPAPGAGGPGRTGAAAFFSTQWSKPFSTGLGGVAVFRDRALYEAARSIRDAFPREGDRRRARSLALQVFLHALMVRPWTHAVVAGAYRWAQRVRLVRGTTTADEYGRNMPQDYLARGLNVQAALGMPELARWQANVEHRRQLTALYLRVLAEVGAAAPGGMRPGDAMWAVPVQVENKDEILRQAASQGLPVATWFDVPQAHVAAGTAARYDYRPGQCPRAERLMQREVHLMTGPSVSARRAGAAVRFLAACARFAEI